MAGKYIYTRIYVGANSLVTEKRNDSSGWQIPWEAQREHIGRIPIQFGESESWCPSDELDCSTLGKLIEFTDTLKAEA